jgi:hypothetical protein
MRRIKEMKHFKINQEVKMSDNAIENYGKEYQDVVFQITHIAKNEKDHPGYDSGLAPEWLYGLKRVDNGEDLQFSLYDWELEAA